MASQHRSGEVSRQVDGAVRIWKAPACHSFVYFLLAAGAAPAAEANEGAARFEYPTGQLRAGPRFDFRKSCIQKYTKNRGRLDVSPRVQLHQENLQFVLMPKCGSSTLKKLLEQQFRGARIGLGDIRSSTVHVAFVRDPYERLLSGYGEYMSRARFARRTILPTEDRQRLPAVQEFLTMVPEAPAQWPEAGMLAAFEKFVDQWYDPTDPPDRHISSQCFFLRDADRFDFVGRVENMTSHWCRLRENYTAMPRDTCLSASRLHARPSRKSRKRMTFPLSGERKRRFCEFVRCDIECLGIASRHCPHIEPLEPTFSAL